MTQRPVSVKDKPEKDSSKSCRPWTDPLIDLDSQPPPEEQLGGGDICSLEETPSTEDDKPLD